MQLMLKGFHDTRRGVTSIYDQPQYSSLVNVALIVELKFIFDTTKTHIMRKL